MNELAVVLPISILKHCLNPSSALFVVKKQIPRLFFSLTIYLDQYTYCYLHSLSAYLADIVLLNCISFFDLLRLTNFQVVGVCLYGYFIYCISPAVVAETGGIFSKVKGIFHITAFRYYVTIYFHS